MIQSRLFVLVATVGLAVGALVMRPSTSRAEVHWPPRVGEPFPDIPLIDQNGKAVKIGSFRGKVILVEYIGMNCPACQAFAGAHDKGPLGKVRPQRGVPSIESLFPRYAGGASLDDRRIVFVQILLYDLSMGKPTQGDAKRWKRHFRTSGANPLVFVPREDLRGSASYKLIPGFQAIDKNFVVRLDSTGHHPQHNLYTELLPAVPELLDELASASSKLPKTSPTRR